MQVCLGCRESSLGRTASPGSRGTLWLSSSPLTLSDRYTPGWSCCRTCTCSYPRPSPGSGLEGCQTWCKVLTDIRANLTIHLLAWPPLVKGEPLMFLPQTSLDTDPNMAKVPKLWFTTPSASVEFALNLCCALASSNSDDTSSKASFRSLNNMGELGF